ncbi:MAG: hydantoinase/oxoprolinase family protein [Thermodesulfobacteriota bacterium]
MRIGIDVGGTFTDVVFIDDITRKISYTKTFTTPGRLAEGVMAGIAKILDIAGASMAKVDYLVHGTTIGTNALIERKGAKTGLITTEGFRDVLEIGRIQRPAAGIYDFSVDNPPPLVPRYLRQEAKERISSDGQVVRPLDEGSVVKAANLFKQEKVEAIGVSFLFSFLNPKHEQQAQEIIKREFPESYVTISSEIAPEFREYERTSTVVINAYLLPILESYIDSLEKELKSKFGRVSLKIMQASGGHITASAAKRQPVNTVNSGPVGGAMAGAFLGRLTGNPRLITVDMGGTSFDISLIDGGVPKVTSEGSFAGLPVKIPVVALSTIGAGGGSIAWVDKGGALNVGPDSSGADPGPACYHRGGELPTVTDANLILGRINPDYFLGGQVKLSRKRAEGAIEKHVARKVKMSVTEAAAGIIRLVDANMVKGISVNSIEKGYHPREFTLIAFGGAGPLHAVSLAKEIGISRVLIPIFPANFSALGLLTSDARHDFVASLAKGSDRVDPGELTQALVQLEDKGRKQLASEGVALENMRFSWYADLRYEGQSYELNTPVPRKKALSQKDVKMVLARFHRMHKKMYAYSSSQERVEFINVRVTALGESPPVRLRPGKPALGPPRGAFKFRRPVYFHPQGFVQTPIYERDRLRPGNQIPGPAVIEEAASATVLLPETGATVDSYGNIVVAS